MRKDTPSAPGIRESSVRQTLDRRIDTAARELGHGLDDSASPLLTAVSPQHLAAAAQVHA